MYIIVGLGNPESEYKNTRHNIGFNVINKIAKDYNINVESKKFDSICGSGIIENQKVILVKPQTYMNNSGESIIQFIRFYKEEIDNIVVVYDDVDIEPGKIRIRKEGSAGGHNGMKSIIQNLQREDFPRIRVGIGKPLTKYNMIQYVLGKISDEDKIELEKGVEKAENAIIELLKNGIDSAMNKYN